MRLLVIIAAFLCIVPYGFAQYEVERTTQRQCYQNPKYMRRNDQSWVALGEHVETISSHDIDVSYDGNKWFHFSGDYCLKNEPPFANEIKRQCAMHCR